MNHAFSRILLLIVIAAVGAGCGLLGFDTGQLSTRGEIEATLQSAALAGEEQDELALEAHLASNIVTQVLSGEGISETQSKDELINQLQSMWADMSTNRIGIHLTDLKVRGSSAEAVGSFTLDFEDNDGNHAQCVGTGSATFTRSGGTWVIDSVTVFDSDCEVTPGEDPDTPGPVPPGVPHFALEQCQYLTLGMRNDQVRAVQESLNYLGYSAGRVDGHYGIITERAVRAFQRDNKLYVDGEFGPKTLAALDSRLRQKGGYYLCGSVEDVPNAGDTFVSYSALRKGTAFETRVIQYDSPVPGPTLVFVGCIHGNEQSGHRALVDAIDGGITISRGRLILVPELNRLACESNRRTLSRSGSALSGKDFNRMYPVGSRPSYLIAQELWDLIRKQPDLAFVVDFHDGFVNSLANSLIHTRQSKAGSVARKLRDNLNEVRPSKATGPKWRSMTEPIAGSLIRKVGRDLGKPGILVELAGRNPGDPLRLRKEYAWRIIRLIGDEYGMAIGFPTT